MFPVMIICLFPPCLRQPGVREVHELQHPAHQLAVHGVVLVVGVEGDAAAHGGADDVDEPREAALLHLDVHLVGVGVGNHLLVGLRRLVEQLHEQLARLPVLAAADDADLVQLLGDHARVVERVLQAVAEDHGHGLQAGRDVGLGHLGGVSLKQVGL